MAVSRREAEPQPVVVVHKSGEASAERAPDDDLASFENVKGALYRRKDFLSTDEAAKSHPNRAYYYRKTEDVDRLIEVCSAKLAQDPHNTRALFIRASSYAKKGDVQRAAADYTRVLQRDPTSEDALFQRGMLLEKAGALDDAIGDFTRVLELNRSHKKAALQRAACQNLKGNLGNLELAINDYELALRGDDSKTGIVLGSKGGRGTGSSGPTASQATARAESTSGASGTGRGAAETASAGAFGPGDRSRSPSPPIGEGPEERTGLPRGSQGRFAEGGPTSPVGAGVASTTGSSRGKEQKSTGKKAGKAPSGGGAVEAHEGFGVSGSGPGAIEPEQRSMDGAGPSLQPNTADYYHARGFAHRKSGNFKAAIEDYSKAVELDPRHFKALFNRGFSYDKVGRGSSAKGMQVAFDI
jgi:tetratricopeptide (TPR) repeat protein